MQSVVISKWAASKLFENVENVATELRCHAIEAFRSMNMRLHAFTDRVTGRRNDKNSCSYNLESATDTNYMSVAEIKNSSE
jgi:hypothetical protein